MTNARTQYSNRPTLKSDLSCEGSKSLTKQGDLKDADINNLMKKFERTGQLPNMIVREPKYGDFSNVPDYQEAMEIVKLATEQFSNLDAPIRNRFDNDPAKFLEFANNPANNDEMAKMGLLNAQGKAVRDSKREADKAAQKAALEAKEAAAKRALIDEIKAELNKPA